MSKTFLEEFKERGFLHQCTDLSKLEEIMKSKKIAAYIGFDLTATSLHVGNLMQIMILRLLQQHGHKPIIIVGGATTKIGDPTGKDQMRKMLSDEDINNNIRGIKKSLGKFFTFGDSPSDAVIINNEDWLNKLGYIEFLREYGKHFSINRMLSMDSVKLRLEREQNLSFLEFNYMLLQGFDFLQLNRKYDCILQIGGSDQWGNIIQGVELARRVDGKEVFGLTTPLLTTSSGAKMGKSVNGAIWINEDMLSSYDYYQYFRNTEDADVIRFTRLYTEMSSEEFITFEECAKDNINEAKKILAFELTKLCHSEDLAIKAANAAKKVFEEGGMEGLPEFEYDVTNKINICELFHLTGLTSSKSEARKLIRGNGAKINDHLVADENMIVTANDLKDGFIKLSAGKKRHMIIKQKCHYTLTDNAAKRIALLSSKEVKNKLLRIAVIGGGCSGFSYEYKFVEKEEEEDYVIEKNGAIILIDKVSQEFLHESVIDYVEELGSSYFEIRNPNATAKCGCGNSFGV